VLDQRRTDPPPGVIRMHRDLLHVRDAVHPVGDQVGHRPVLLVGRHPGPPVGLITEQHLRGQRLVARDPVHPDRPEDPPGNHLDLLQRFDLVGPGHPDQGSLPGLGADIDPQPQRGDQFEDQAHLDRGFAGLEVGEPAATQPGTGGQLGLTQAGEAALVAQISAQVFRIAQSHAASARAPGQHRLATVRVPAHRLFCARTRSFLEVAQ
jgi:hypothetical protein